jgi:hypothetical protein
MGIFRDITKSLKKAAPLIGAGIGMFYGGPLGASIGSGIGSLASGRSAEEALRNAALAGVSTYAMGGSDFGKGFNFSTADSPLQGMFGSTATPTNAMYSNDAIPTAIKSADTGGIGSFLKGMIPESTAGKIALGGAGLALLGGEKEDKNQNNLMRDYPVGRTRLGTGRIGDKLYNLDDEEERKQYFEDNRKRQGTEDIESEEERERYSKGIGFMVGGEVEGPGTGTSDSVPARLSDGEFVVTAKAVRGAGNGDRNVGAARMYDMMSQLERVA